MAVRITCINKASGDHENPYVAISHLGWVDSSGGMGKSTRIEIYDFIQGGEVAYVENSAGSRANLVTRVSPRGTKYVKTEADATETNNLLKLPEC